MSLRSGNIGVAIAVAMMAVGVLLVGADPSDTEKQLIFWPAFFTGIVVAVLLVGRDERREGERRSSRG